jgi:type I restriction enzyme M protein
LKLSDISNIKIPLPPLEIQKEIVEQIEVKQKAIEGAKQVIENLERERRYFGQSLRKLENVEMLKLSEICKVNAKTADPVKLFGDSEFIYIDISSVENGTGFVDLTNKIEATQAPSRARRIVKQNDILLSTVRPNLKAYAHLDNLPKETLASTGFAVLSSGEKVMSKYLYYILFTDDLQNQMISKMDKGAYPSINQNDVENLIVPVVSKEEQDKLVMDMENQEKVILSNKKLIDLMEKKIEGVLETI